MKNHSAQFLYDTLRLVAEYAYKSDVLDCGMEDITIGHDQEFADKDQWISEKVNEWMADAEKMYADLIPSIAKREFGDIGKIAKMYYKMPLGSTVDLGNGMKVIRVPGGWMHVYQTTLGITSVFVQWNDEFQREGDW